MGEPITVAYKENGTPKQARAELEATTMWNTDLNGQRVRCNHYRILCKKVATSWWPARDDMLLREQAIACARVELRWRMGWSDLDPMTGAEKGQAAPKQMGLFDEVD